jgi:hypothetical protein
MALRAVAVFNRREFERCVVLFARSVFRAKLGCGLRYGRLVVRDCGRGCVVMLVVV